jgi:hypothetical protein
MIFFHIYIWVPTKAFPRVFTLKVCLYVSFYSCCLSLLVILLIVSTRSMLGSNHRSHHSVIIFDLSLILPFQVQIFTSGAHSRPTCPHSELLTLPDSLLNQTPDLRSAWMTTLCGFAYRVAFAAVISSTQEAMNSKAMKSAAKKIICVYPLSELSFVSCSCQTARRMLSSL